MKRIFNFSAGPAMLPLEVLEQAAKEMFDYKGSGMSVMEMSHRSKIYQSIIDEAEADLRKLLNIPDNYKVLFLQGGATLQFSMIPMNLMKNGVADYVDTGVWTKKAIKEAQIYGKVNIIASSEDKNYTYIPNMDNLKISENADYVYICDNNTIFGTKYSKYPETGNIPLVVDMSSCFLSEPIDVSKFGLIFAGAQKNVGPAGVTIVIIREDLINDNPNAMTPTYLKYHIHTSNGSMYNTPPTYGIYICGLVFKHLLALGGLEAVKERNMAKAKLIYDYLDNSKLFYPTIKDVNSRSIMNVCFRTPNEGLDAEFIEGSKKYEFTNLKGHRLSGGMRASIYNAMPIEGVKALLEYMKEFEENHLK